MREPMDRVAPEDWPKAHGRDPDDSSEFWSFIILCLVAWGVYMIFRSCSHEEEPVPPVNDAALTDAAPAFETIWATLPTVTPAEDGTIHAFSFASADLAVAKFNGTDGGEILAVIGYHGDSLEALQKRFEDGVNLQEETKISCKFSPVVSPTDDQAVAEFEDGVLKIGHSDIRRLVPTPIPVILYGDDGEIIFWGEMQEDSAPEYEGPSVINA